MLVGSFDPAVAAAITEVAEQRGVPSVVNIDAAPQITDHVAGAQRLCVAARVGVGLDPVEVVDGAPRAEDDPVAEIDDRRVIPVLRSSMTPGSGGIFRTGHASSPWTRPGRLLDDRRPGGEALEVKEQRGIPSHSALDLHLVDADREIAARTRQARPATGVGGVTAGRLAGRDP